MNESIVRAIQDSSFPDSEEILSASLNSSNIPSLLNEIQIAKNDLNDAVCAISREQAADVDGWIVQAKRAQQDILQCKASFKHIVDEHSRIEALRNERVDAHSKVVLLENEIAFNETLQTQILSIADTNTALGRIEEEINLSRLPQAAHIFSSLDTSINAITSHQSKSLLLQAKSDIFKRLRSRLDGFVDESVNVENNKNEISWTVSGRSPPATETNPSLEQTLDALTVLGAIGETQRNITKRLDSSILPHLHKRSKLHVHNVVLDDAHLQMILTADCPSATITTKCLRTLLEFVHRKFPPQLRSGTLEGLCEQVIPLLIVTWLDPAVPSELDELLKSQDLQQTVKELADWLTEVNMDQGRHLASWVNQISRTWLARRKASSLDAVRDALAKASTVTRQVERVEKRVVTAEELSAQHDDAGDDWAENWGDEDGKDEQNQITPSDTTDEDGSDAWGFDTDDHNSSKNETSTATNPTVEDDEADAWGWGDEEKDNDANSTSKLGSKPSATTLSTAKPRANGASSLPLHDQELTLSEQYTVTSIPDLIITRINHDTADYHTLQSSSHTYFRSTTSPTAPSGMQSLPTLVLAMFRAITPDHYSTTPSLTLMNLYNDTLYLLQTLTDFSTSTSTSPNPLITDSDMTSLSKFARQIYTSELTTQRTILHDLLDNAQGFGSCTTEPYLSQCESAIASTSDYIRALHAQWSKILSPSHLSQSIGSLLNSIMSKMIKDIEDMEDISEPQSQKLIQFMDKISALQDLFVASGGQPQLRQQLLDQGQIEGESASKSTIAIHVPSYLRFQYLSQMLEGSLADIKYLWTDAGLGLEFSKEEVVDLIEALFAESTHRRNAIQVIRA